MFSRGLIQILNYYLSNSNIISCSKHLYAYNIENIYNFSKSIVNYDFRFTLLPTPFQTKTNHYHKLLPLEKLFVLSRAELKIIGSENCWYIIIRLFFRHLISLFYYSFSFLQQLFLFYLLIFCLFLFDIVVTIIKDI